MKTTVENIKAMKGKSKIAMLTSYDYSMAKLVDAAGVDMILVGDSLGMVQLGYTTTQKVTVKDMLFALRGVRNAVKSALVILDMPYQSYDEKEVSLENATLFMENGADAVKVENKPEIVTFLVKNDIPVQGHIGLTPQTITDFKVQGRTEEQAEQLLSSAKEIEHAGAFSLVLESVPATLAKKITESISIPTIGIGAGLDCDGQVLVVNDMLGLFTDFKPKFVKKYAQLGEEVKKAVSAYVKEVKEKKFPSEEFWFR